MFLLRAPVHADWHMLSTRNGLLWVEVLMIYILSTETMLTSLLVPHRFALQKCHSIPRLVPHHMIYSCVGLTTSVRWFVCSNESLGGNICLSHDYSCEGLTTFSHVTGFSQNKHLLLASCSSHKLWQFQCAISIQDLWMGVYLSQWMLIWSAYNNMHSSSSDSVTACSLCLLQKFTCFLA